MAKAQNGKTVYVVTSDYGCSECGGGYVESVHLTKIGAQAAVVLLKNSERTKYLDYLIEGRELEV
jgi:hypothetical protein